MTNWQNLFDRAVGGVLKQGRPSYNRRTEACCYRGPSGTKCAVGHLIDDEHYHPDLDTEINVYDQRVKDALLASNPDLDLVTPSETVRLLDQLQQAHDSAAVSTDGQFLNLFRQAAHRIARIYNLEWNHD